MLTTLILRRCKFCVQAGHYTTHMLYLAAASFAVTVALLILIPSYGIGLLALTGCLLLSCNAVFYMLYPRLHDIQYFKDLLSSFSDKIIYINDIDIRSINIIL